MKIQTGLEVDEDVDGNPIAAPPADSNVGQLIYLLEWGRRRGFSIGPVIRIGGLVVQVADTRADTQPEMPKDLGVWAAHGHTEEP